MSDRVITLTTDFGTSDAYVGLMKGVIAGIAPSAALIDLTHEIEPQNILHAALVLEQAADYFPASTIHLAVVDPGVGSNRKPIAVYAGDQFFVAPDNGLLTAVLDRLPFSAAVQLDNPQYHHHPVSRTFHGRDIFAPAAAHLAAGIELSQLGSPIDSLNRVDVPEPRRPSGASDRANSLEIQTLYIDHFGNAITNLSRKHLDRFASAATSGQANVFVSYEQSGRRHSIPLCSTYADVQPGEPLAYIGSSGRLELAIRNGNAASQLGIAAGSTALVHADTV